MNDLERINELLLKVIHNEQEIIRRFEAMEKMLDNVMVALIGEEDASCE